jgi:hypothetical protein
VNKSTRDLLVDVTVLVAALLWIPLLVAAFFAAPDVPAYVKLVTGAVMSLAVLLVVWVRETT